MLKFKEEFRENILFYANGNTKVYLCDEGIDIYKAIYFDTKDSKFCIEIKFKKFEERLEILKVIESKGEDKRRIPSGKYNEYMEMINLASFFYTENKMEKKEEGKYKRCSRCMAMCSEKDFVKDTLKFQNMCKECYKKREIERRMLMHKKQSSTHI